MRLIKNETLAQAFCCEFCEIFKNTFFTEHLRMTAFAVANCTYNVKLTLMYKRPIAAVENFNNKKFIYQVFKNFWQVFSFHH